MGDNPSFLFAVIFAFLFVLSQGACYFCSNSFVSLFYCIVVPSKVFYWKLMQDFDFCAVTDFWLSRIWAFLPVENSKNSTKNHASSWDMYETFINLDLFHLSNLSVSNKFVFTDYSVFDRFCLSFCIASFTMFDWISLLH